MSQTTDKTHYSWTPASTKSSQSIIGSPGNAAGNEKTDPRTFQEQTSTIPVIPRRSSYNYAHDSASFSGVGGNSSTRGSAETPTTQTKELKDSEVEGLQRKFFHERRKSYTMDDQKHTQLEFILKGRDTQSFSEV